MVLTCPIHDRKENNMSDRIPPSRTYKSAGVNIDSGNSLVESIKPLSAMSSRPGSMGNLGGFGGLFDISKAGFTDPILVSGTDGVGTKLLMAIKTEMHETIGIDLVAMCVNDVISQGAEPLFFLDYFACSKIEEKIAKKVIEGVAKGCIEAKCALVGGETAEMPGMYSNGHYDLAGFCVGAAERESILPTGVKQGDIVFGAMSSGAHSNGFSLIRKIIDDTKTDLLSPAPFDNQIILAEALMEPTRIYVDPVLKLLKNKVEIHSIAHITGGGLLENIPRVIPDELNAVIDTKTWDLPPLFGWIHEVGNVDFPELYRTFNCGIGLTLIAPSESRDSINKAFNGNLIEIGEIVKNETSPNSCCHLVGLEDK
tara:strand:+ start:3387 stop:4493 length:1107 start_codon:yes stop_codon:yes gene_type:complete